MEFIKLEAWPRVPGKRHNSQLRREDKVPVIAYGSGLAARPLAISPKDLDAAVRGPFGANVILQVSVGQEPPFPAIIHDHAHHPVTRALLHVDLLHIDLSKPIDIDVPLICTGKAIGIVEGGVLRQVYRQLPLRCLPSAIPQSIEYDVTLMKQGDSAKTSDLGLPPEVTARLPADQTVIAIVAPEAEKPEEGAPGVAVPVDGQVPGAPVAAAAPDGAAPASPTSAAAAAPTKKESKKESKKEGKKERDRK